MKRVFLSIAFLVIASVFGAFCQEDAPFAEFSKISIPDSVVFESIKMNDFSDIEVHLVSDNQSYKGKIKIEVIGIKVKDDKIIGIISKVTATNFGAPNDFIAKKIKIKCTKRIDLGINEYVRTFFYDIVKETWD